MKNVEPNFIKNQKYLLRIQSTFAGYGCVSLKILEMDRLKQTEISRNLRLKKSISQE